MIQSAGQRSRQLRDPTVCRRATLHPLVIVSYLSLTSNKTPGLFDGSYGQLTLAML